MLWARSELGAVSSRGEGREGCLESEGGSEGNMKEEAVELVLGRPAGVPQEEQEWGLGAPSRGTSSSFT